MLRAFLRAWCFALVITGLILPQRAVAFAPATTCPQIWTFERIGQLNLYALTLRTNAPTTVDLTIKLQAGSDPYITKVPAVAIDRSTSAALVPYRSSVIVLPEPTDTKTSEVIVAFASTSAACPDEARSIGGPRDFAPAEAGKPTGIYNDLREKIRAESLNAMPVEMLADPNPPALCAEKPARATHAAYPDYPLVAKQNGSTGTVGIIIDLDEMGNIRRADLYHSSGDPTLDAAARVAAVSSTFESATIGCIVTPSTYLFRVDFMMG
jgi:TonB family protein